MINHSKKFTIQRKWVKKDMFDWSFSQEKSFNHIKKLITNNIIIEVNLTAQYHLIINASKRDVSEVLFQLKEVLIETEAIFKLLSNKRIIMFLSFKLENAEIKYFNLKCKCLAVIKCLTKIKWLIIENDHSVLIYLNHEALKFIFIIKNIDQIKIVDWMNRLKEYNLKLTYCSSRNQHIEIADELSKIFTRLMFIIKTHDAEKNLQIYQSWCSINSDFWIYDNDWNELIKICYSHWFENWSCLHTSDSWLFFKIWMSKSLSVSHSYKDSEYVSKSHFF